MYPISELQEKMICLNLTKRKTFIFLTAMIQLLGFCTISYRYIIWYVSTSFCHCQLVSLYVSQIPYMSASFLICQLVSLYVTQIPYMSASFLICQLVFLYVSQFQLHVSQFPYMSASFHINQQVSLYVSQFLLHVTLFLLCVSWVFLCVSYVLLYISQSSYVCQLVFVTSHCQLVSLYESASFF